MDFEQWFKDHRYSDTPLCYGAAKDGFEAGQQSKQTQINKALELLRQPMQGTVADLLNELEDILDDT